MKTYRVILVDDEPIILQGLQILINWASYGFEIVGCASDGAEGLHLIQTLSPDLVISDIQMPNMSGVEMISQAHDIYRCKYIVLSGYSDFSYAQQCISYGVQEYLLKPVIEEELIQALEKVKLCIDSEAASDAAMTQLDDLNQQLHILAADEFLRDISNSYFETDEDFYHSLSDYALQFPKGEHYLAVSFQTSSSDNISLLRDVLTEQLDAFGCNYLLFYYGNNTYMCLFTFSENCTAAETHKDIQQLHTQITACWKADLCIGIGKLDTQVRMLPLSCQQALHALSFKIIRGANSVNPFDSTLQNAHFIQTIPEELWNTYRQSLLQSNFASISGAIQKIFRYMTTVSKMPVLGIHINTLNLIMTCIQYLSELQTFPGVSYDDSNFMTQISTIQTAEELEKYTENMVYSLINNNRDVEIAKPTELIQRVENYINENYLEDLSLMNIARVFYISPIYLSQTFKKQTGQLYLDYITQVKINAAKKMLLTTDLLVYEIAEQLHYKDPKYFSKLFEKKTGKKPSEFRKNPN
ncbi:response regulator transcription factor [Mediterraneibacter agrestimuris]|uniref:response regulator transcription factor n=1 Tax=Mediterraneibacter agrestimuris TaxID=2941333 RepID=UPI00203AE55B|nr:response regulator transcription factor [Mediterraneibacter agrestimuris]